MRAVSNSEAIMRDNNNRRRNDRDKQPESDIKDRLVTINRSTKTTKGGRTFTFTGIVVVGDEKGKVGHGAGRSREVVTAIQALSLPGAPKLPELPAIPEDGPPVQLTAEEIDAMAAAPGVKSGLCAGSSLAS